LTATNLLLQIVFYARSKGVDPDMLEQRCQKTFKNAIAFINHCINWHSFAYYASLRNLKRGVNNPEEWWVEQALRELDSIDLEDEDPPERRPTLREWRPSLFEWQAKFEKHVDKIVELLSAVTIQRPRAKIAQLEAEIRDSETELIALTKSNHITTGGYRDRSGAVAPYNADFPPPQDPDVAPLDVDDLEERFLLPPTTSFGQRRSIWRYPDEAVLLTGFTNERRRAGAWPGEWRPRGWQDRVVWGQWGDDRGPFWGNRQGQPFVEPSPDDAPAPTTGAAVGPAGGGGGGGAAAGGATPAAAPAPVPAAPAGATGEGRGGGRGGPGGTNEPIGMARGRGGRGGPVGMARGRSGGQASKAFAASGVPRSMFVDTTLNKRKRTSDTGFGDSAAALAKRQQGLAPLPTPRQSLFTDVSPVA
jgi:hypothetical protein